MKRVLKLLLISIFTLSLVIFVACENETEIEKEEIFTFKDSQIVVDLYETKVINFESNIGNPTYSSSNEEVLEIRDGKIYGKEVGNANIIAKIGEKEVSKNVTVELNDEKLVYDFLSEEMYLVLGTSLKINPQMSYNGEAFESISEISTTGSSLQYNNGTILGKELGEQIVNISSKHNDRVVKSTQIKVNVINYGTIETGIDGNSVELYVTNYSGDKTTEYNLNNVRCFVNGVEVFEDVVFEPSDDSFLAIDNGIVSCKKSGEGLVNCKFTYNNETYDTSIVIKGNKELVNSNLAFKVLSGSKSDKNDSGISTLDFAGKNDILDPKDITELYINDSKVSYNHSGTMLNLRGAPCGNNKYTAITDKVDVIFDCLIYQNEITSMDEFKTFASNLSSLSNYTILSTDLDFGGKPLGFVDTWWRGTFDGQGHTLSNFEMNYGFMRWSNEACIIKNLQLINCTLDLRKCTQETDTKTIGMLGEAYTGDYENILVIGKIIGAKDNQSLVLAQEYSSTEFNNVLIFVDTFEDVQTSGFGSSYSQSNGINALNTYVINDKIKTFKLTTATSNLAEKYEDINTFLNNTDLSGFEKAGWTVGEGIPYMTDYKAYINNFSVAFDKEIETNSQVKIISSLFDSTYSIKEVNPKAELSNGTLMLGNEPTSFTLVIENSVLGAKREFPVNVYNSSTFTLDSNYVYVSSGKATIPLTSITPTISKSSVTKILVNDVETPFTASVIGITFDLNIIGNFNLKIVTNDLAYKANLVAAFAISDDKTFREFFRSNYTLGVLTNDVGLKVDTELNSSIKEGFVLDGQGFTLSNLYDWSGWFENGAGNFTIKNLKTQSFKSFCSIFGSSLYGTINIENCEFNVFLPDGASTSYYLIDTTKNPLDLYITNTIFNISLGGDVIASKDIGIYEMVDNVNIVFENAVLKEYKDGLLIGETTLEN